MSEYSSRYLCTQQGLTSIFMTLGIVLYAAVQYNTVVLRIYKTEKIVRREEREGWKKKFVRVENTTMYTARNSIPRRPMVLHKSLRPTRPCALVYYRCVTETHYFIECCRRSIRYTFVRPERSRGEQNGSWTCNTRPTPCICKYVPTFFVLI